MLSKEGQQGMEFWNTLDSARLYMEAKVRRAGYERPGLIEYDGIPYVHFETGLIHASVNLNNIEKDTKDPLRTLRYIKTLIARVCEPNMRDLVVSSHEAAAVVWKGWTEKELKNN